MNDGARPRLFAAGRLLPHASPRPMSSSSSGWGHSAAGSADTAGAAGREVDGGGGGGGGIDALLAAAALASSARVARGDDRSVALDCDGGGDRSAAKRRWGSGGACGESPLREPAFVSGGNPNASPLLAPRGVSTSCSATTGSVDCTAGDGDWLVRSESRPRATTKQRPRRRGWGFGRSAAMIAVHNRAKGTASPCNLAMSSA